MRQWILGTLNAPDSAECAQRVKPIAEVLRVFPRRPARKSAALTLAAVGQTLREAQAIDWFGLSKPVRGLFGGKFVTGKNGINFTLTRYSDAPGVVLGGKITFVNIGPPATYKGTIKVSGSAAVAGTLKVSKNGRVSSATGASLR